MVKGNDEPIKINEEIGLSICPRLIYINTDEKNSNYKFVEEYLGKSDGLLLDVMEIERIRNRKGINNGMNEQDKMFILTEIIYKDLLRK
jgi:hypothetical protein